MSIRPRSILALLFALAVAGGLAFAACGYLSARADPIRRETSVAMAEWPDGAAPVRVALISDIHIGGGAMDERRLNRIVDQINASRPDLILIAGDFIYGADPVAGARYAQQLTAPLARLRAPLGVVAVLGNHDHWTAPLAVEAALSRAGIDVLNNAADQRGPLVIVGLDDPFTDHDGVIDALASAANFTGARVLLAHTPDVASRLPPALPLVLAGHTHCGQVVLPVLGPALTNSPRAGFKRIYDPHYRCGVIHDRGRDVIVTAGLGASGPQVRIGALPDWWLITLGPR